MFFFLLFYIGLKMVQSSYKSFKSGVVTGRQNGRWEYGRDTEPMIFYFVVLMQFIASSFFALFTGFILVNSIMKSF